MKQWYAAHTKANCEHQVAAIMQQRGFNTYLPQVPILENKNKLLWKPFFPTYLFVEADFEEGVAAELKWTPGLKCLVAFDDEPPVPVPNGTIEYLRRELATIEADGGWEAYTFEPGDEVKITQGPLRNMSALFERTLTPHGRVQILLTYLGQVRRIQIDRTDLGKVETAPQKSNRSRRTRGKGRSIYYLNG
ncbi:MAG TPA: transcription termination/antitermination NusG family protein [Chloroflexota bacterium]|nr:transcription termination/antitermination NusG family protein [Chloroflexota bacterium]HUM69795.1 transcription termination/antitermination NusG family protein [Chloroflexota bacterium]